MPKVSSSIVIQKPIEEVFDFTASPKSGPFFIPNLRENINVTPEHPCLGQKFHWRYNLLGIELEGDGEVTEFERPTLDVMKCTGEAESEWRYAFHSENGATLVTATVEYNIPENVLGRIANRVALEGINQRAVVQMLDNLKLILES